MQVADRDHRPGGTRAEEPTLTITLPTNVLRALASIAPKPRDAGRNARPGVYIEPRPDGTAEATATDGKILVTATIPHKSPPFEAVDALAGNPCMRAPVIIPRKQCRDLNPGRTATIAVDADGPADVTIVQTSSRTDPVTTEAEEVGGKFPDPYDIYNQINDARRAPNTQTLCINPRRAAEFFAAIADIVAAMPQPDPYAREPIVTMTIIDPSRPIQIRAHGLYAAMMPTSGG